MVEQIDNKYYTPEISEFYVKFIFEGYNTTSNYPEKDKWVQFEMGLGLGEQWSRIENYINNKQIRVKYLDAKDIEELGFKLECESLLEKGPFNYKFRKDNYILEYFNWFVKGSSEQGVEFDYQQASEYRKVIVRYEDTTSPFVGGYTMFRGNIKNKSELKKLLVQLGIEYNK